MVSSSTIPVPLHSNENPTAPRSRKDGKSWLLPLLYRCWLLGATAILTLLLLRLQALFEAPPLQANFLQPIIQWAQLSWLIPVPFAIVVWLGWFIFAEAVRPISLPVEAPWISVERDFPGLAPLKPVNLVFRFVTCGKNVDVLQESVLAVHQAFARYALTSGPYPYKIEIVSDSSFAIDPVANKLTRVYVVPSEYMTEKQSRFKARALTYLQEQVHPQPEDWYIYLDEESIIDETMIAGIYRFIWRSILTKTHIQETSSFPEYADKKMQGSAGLIGQGVILYQGGKWLFRGADGLRTADDLGRFRLQYGLGIPIFGIHGSFIVIHSEDDARLSFDVGRANSLAEDAAWSMRAWVKGFRFAWVEGTLHEQPPQRIKDFVGQRSRWLSGLRSVSRDTEVPLRYRLCLGILVGLWHLSFLPILVATVGVFVHASPFVWMRIPADFGWATVLLSYVQGLDFQAKRVRHLSRESIGRQSDNQEITHPLSKVASEGTGPLSSKIRMFITRAFSWSLVSCFVWYALLEAAGVLYSLRPEQNFFVIKKPSLVSQSKTQEKRDRKMKLHASQKYVALISMILLGLGLQWTLTSGLLPGNFFAPTQNGSADCSFKTSALTSTVQINGMITSAPPIRRSQFQTGVIFPQWGTAAYSSKDSNWQIGLNEIQSQTGAQWIELPINLYQPTLVSTNIQAAQFTPTPQAVAEGIDAAHSMHYHVFVTPQLTVGGARPWAGEIQFPTVQETQEWFDNYWRIFKPYVVAASQAGAEELAIGTEYELLQSAPAFLWNQLITRTHSSFSGKLTYNMNWSSMANPIPTWMRHPYLDSIGVSEYIPLIDAPKRLNPNVLAMLWKEKIKTALDSLATQLGKPVLLSEIGYRDSEDALYNPWELTTNAGKDEVEQAAAYNAAFLNILPDPSIAGTFIWAWSIPLFSPNCRLAAQILRHWYTTI